MKQATSLRPFGWRDKLGYLFGDLGNDFTFILSSSFLLKFYTDVMEVPAAVVGTVMMLARFVDAFTDVTMGRITDRARVGRSGKFKPWILRMCLPVAFSSFLIYQSAFAASPMIIRIIWLTVSYILWGSVFYTAVNIPYGSMASAISPEPDHRQSLSTYRTMGSTLAGVVIGAGVPLFAYDYVSSEGREIALLNGGRFTLIAGIFSVLAVIAYILCYLFVTERTVSDGGDVGARRSIGRLLSSAVKNRALISIIVASVVMLLSQITLQQMSNYVYPDYYANTGAQSASTVAMMVGMTVAAGAARPLARRFGKAEISVVANLLAAGVSLLLFFIRPESVWVYVALSFAAWLGLGIFSVVSWALITDVIDYSEIRNGVREDGSIYALYSFARKLGQAAAAGLTGALLSLIGYGRTEGGVISDAVREGIFDISTLVPAVGFSLLGFILWFWYPLHKREVEENVRVLEKKRK